MWYSRLATTSKVTRDEYLAKQAAHVTEDSDEVDSLHESVKRIKGKESNAQNLLQTALFKMVALFIVGCLGAVAHELFYHRLHGQVVRSSGVSQEWALRIGTGLAFLTKTSWTIAVIVAQVQQAWSTLDKKHLEVRTIDAMFAAPTDFTKFGRWSMLRHAKMATLLSLIAWVLPLSAIVTPATLTVIPRLQTAKSVWTNVPMVNFTNAANFAALGTCGMGSCPVLSAPSTGYYSVLQFRYPTPQTVVVAAASSSAGRIQQVTPEYQNSTYSISFLGPSVQCSPANKTTIAEIDRINNLTAPSAKSYEFSGVPIATYYGFIPALNPRGQLVPADLSKLPNSWDQIANASIPLAPELWIRSGQYEQETHHVCALFNTSYAVDFTFSNGIQSQSISITPMEPLPYAIGLADASNREIAIGPQFELFTYQAIWISLVQQVVGRFTDSPLDTNLFQTPVVTSKDFQQYFSRGFGSTVVPLVRDQTIPEIIEEMSRNVTLSFFSSTNHLVDGGVRTNVTVDEMTNIYRFNQTTLLISYGVALLVALACIAIGFIACRHDGGRRENVFSTIALAVEESKTQHDR